MNGVKLLEDIQKALDMFEKQGPYNPAPVVLGPETWTWATKYAYADLTPERKLKVMVILGITSEHALEMFLDEHYKGA